jgi:putative phosphoesterase
MKIGLISDTHSYLDPAVFDHFDGVEHILHAGDIGPQSIILELEKLAPVTAVTGNTDSYLPYQETEVVRLAEQNLLLHHIVSPAALSESLERRIQREQAQVVVFGHTHKPFAETIGEILFFNPGYAGKPRFNQKRTVAIMQLAPTGITYQFIDMQ